MSTSAFAPPDAGTWAFVISCRDLASDFVGLRAGPSGQVIAPLHAYQRDILVHLLTREANRIEDEKMNLFDREQIREERK